MDLESAGMVRCHRGLPQLVLNIDAPQSTQMRSSWGERAFRYGPLVLWIALIFFFSSTAASANQTSRIIGPLLQFFFPSIADDTLQQVHFFLRKCAHLTEYGLLAFWAIRAWKYSSFLAVKKYRYMLAVLTVLVVASVDEFIQSFEPSRTSSQWDVGLDLIGGIIIAIAFWLGEIIDRTRGKPSRG